MSLPYLPTDIVKLILSFSSLDAAVYCRCTSVVQAKCNLEFDVFNKFFRTSISLDDVSSVMYLCWLVNNGLIPPGDTLIHIVHTAHIGLFSMFRLLHRRLNNIFTELCFMYALSHASYEGHVCIVRYILDSGVISSYEHPSCIARYFAEKAKPWFRGAPSNAVLDYLYEGTKQKDDCDCVHTLVCLPYIFE